jgi:uncharacterized Ntn-hydrolase superfamily protein
MSIRRKHNMCRLSVLLLGVCGLVLLSDQSVHATWSIVAVDPRTGEVGSAGASCTPAVALILGIAPGKGVIVAQAKSNLKARRTGVDMLLRGARPEDIIKTITHPSFDPEHALQQYGIAALEPAPSAGAYTGTDTALQSGDIQGECMSVQGNFLAGSDVLYAAYEAFHANSGLSLADRLLAALEAGAAEGGDRRCGEQRALSAYLVVAHPSDAARTASLGIVIPGQPKGRTNPVVLLRRKYDQAGDTGLAAHFLPLPVLLLLLLIPPVVGACVVALIRRPSLPAGMCMSAVIPPTLFFGEARILVSLTYVVYLWREAYLVIALLTSILGVLMLLALQGRPPSTKRQTSSTG